MTKTERLIENAYLIRESREQLTAELAELEATIIALGPGKHTGSDPDRVVTVVAEVPGGVSYKLGADALEEVREISGAEFSNLFERTVVHTPCKSFADVVPKVLGKRFATRLLDLCGKPTSAKSAHCRYKS
jgi:hypothetical protein